MRVIYNVNHHYVIRLKLEDKLLTTLNKLALVQKKVSALKSKKIYFYIAVSFRHLLSLP